MIMRESIIAKISPFLELQNGEQNEKKIEKKIGKLHSYPKADRPLGFE
jgi:hypothetical protein